MGRPDGLRERLQIHKMYDNAGHAVAGRFAGAAASKDRKEKAEQLFNEYITLFGSNPDPNENAWYYRGQLYKDTGRLAEAKADLQKAASMGSKDAAKLLAEMK